MGKRKYYLILDTETATLPFADRIATTAEQKKKIAIAKPLVYDIGWTIATTQGEIVDRKNFLVQETFFVPNVFNTAYYKEKRPLYMEKLAKGEIKVDCWNNIIDILLADLRKVNVSTAFNACFDFKKAIPFTERYISALYSTDYNKWETRQYHVCKKIVEGKDNSKNAEYLNPYLELRNEKFDIIDLWGLACDRLINIPKYKNFCLDNSFVTNSAIYFKTSAEVVFQYLNKDITFEEKHTALDDSEIETFILSKCLKKGKIIPNIESFPFRKLGTTYEYALEKKKVNYVEKLIELLDAYFTQKEDNISHTSYWIRMENIMDRLKEFIYNE